jgi:pyruvate formate lyase activating enzyme
VSDEEGFPLIFNIHRFALDDGPGIRTTVFMKGCPLACRWCHNPESIRPGKEIAFERERCIRCGECETVCPEDAIDSASPGRIVRARCTACGMCADVCPTTALKLVGQHYPVDELVELLLRDVFLYQTSQGGVTFSGGEPTLHMDYVARVMGELKRHDIHLVLQTSGMFDLRDFREKLLPHLDLIHYDLKLMDPPLHRRYTGRSNSRILRNFAALSRQEKVRIIARTPLVPGVTATEANLTAIDAFLRGLGVTEHLLLPYNSGGASKGISLGRRPPRLLTRGQGTQSGPIAAGLTR